MQNSVQNVWKNVCIYQFVREDDIIFGNIGKFSEFAR